MQVPSKLIRREYVMPRTRDLDDSPFVEVLETAWNAMSADRSRGRQGEQRKTAESCRYSEHEGNFESGPRMRGRVARAIDSDG